VESGACGRRLLLCADDGGAACAVADFTGRTSVNRMRVLHLLGLLLAAAAFAAWPAYGFAQGAAPAKPEMTRACPGLVAGQPPFRSLVKRVALKPDEVRLTFIGHATFLIESPQLVRIATDYNDYIRPPVLPDIVTMNHAHASHYTDRPDPAIKYVLRGWAQDPRNPKPIDLIYKDVRVHNVFTNIRTWDGGTEFYGNSIFVFEIADLCIAHLGHLHHTLTQQQLNEIGKVDVVLVPVDGNYTLDLDGMIEVLHALKAPLMIPMHYFGSVTLDRFLAQIGREWPVEMREVPSLVISKATIPTTPKVVVLPGH
jgi:L-ascorbate metabolism protein UlaG (beta-lactamase superfamily)